MKYTVDNILIRPNATSAKSGLILDITPELAGWQYINFQARHLDTGASWSFATGENECAIVNLTGKYRVESNRGLWEGIGGRRSVFEGPAHALYLPRESTFTITAEEEGDFAVTWTPADQDFPAFLTRPENVKVSIRGGDHACRQINDLMPPGSPVQRLVLVEVYTPGGNWSSYPPHKHDLHETGPHGELLEADLEEVYFFRFNRPEGYAFMRVYTDDSSPLQKAGNPIDTVVAPHENCAVLVPEGYHPVSSPPGYMTYYLNVLAGTAQSLANRDDPRYTWVKDNYRVHTDDRLPIY